jgi:hypothetical protein
VLKTLPYHASGYGKPRSGRSDADYPDREGQAIITYMRAAWREYQMLYPLLAGQCSKCFER